MPIPFGRLGLLFELFSASFYPPRAKQHLRDFIARVGGAGIVADIGGGTGTLLNLAHEARPGLRYVCVDPAEGMLKRVRPYAFRVAARSEALPFRDSVISGVMIGDAIHHFSDLDRAIEEVRRVLTDDGRLFIFDINPETFMDRLVVALERVLGEPAQFRSPDQLKHLLIKKGVVLRATGGGARYTVEAEKAPSSSPHDNSPVPV